MRRMLGALLGVAVACAACGDRGTDDSVPTTNDPTTTSTRAPDPTTTTSSTEPVPFDVEVRRAAIELLEIRNDVFMHPDVARVSEYIADTCTCLERERGFIERFVAEGLRWEAAPIEVVGITLDTRAEAEPFLSLVAIQGETAVVDRDGHVTTEVPPDDSISLQLALSRTAGGAWLINLLEAADFNNETIAEIRAIGLP